MNRFLMNRFCLPVVATGVFLSCAGCAQRASDAETMQTAQAAPSAPKVETHAGLNSTLWVQTAVEARVSSLQAYKLASLQLDAALKNKSWTASTEQAARPVKEWHRLPPAILLDIDETVLDNSPLQARLVKKGMDYDSMEFGQWVYEAQAKAIPGSVAFVNAARKKGIKIFYISNRARNEEAATQKNMQRVGLLKTISDDQVLSRFEKVSWQSDKTSRRRFIADKYRVLMLVGDDFNDFVTGAKTSLEEREKLMLRHQKMWGEKWIVIPNPLYGSWEGSVLDFNYERTPDEQLKEKYSELDTLEIPEP